MSASNDEHMESAQKAIPPEARFWNYVRFPRHLGYCSRANASAMGVGSCGDSVCLDLCVHDGRITEVACRPNGCVYTQVCACAVSDLANGRTLDEALQIQPEDVARALDGLPRDHMHCARLAVNTLGEAVAEYYRKETLQGNEKTDAG